ncbi:MAG: hypothetical protein JO041_04285, partial [Acidobacteria bacterium]|nr:hypothetical protein [Acidobacteriota bacterium]
ATRINPYPADYWLEMATAYSVAGDNKRLENAIERAQRAAPFDTAVLWDVANLNLMRGDTAEGLRQLRTAMQYSADSWDRYVQLCWRITGSVDTVLRDAIPPVSQAYSSLLQLTVYEDRPEDAVKVWSAAESLKLPMEKAEALRYFDFLLNRGRAADAEQQWRRFAGYSPVLARYGSSDENLIVNPRFEQPVLNGGLDWRYASAQDATVAMDPGTSRTGRASLSMRLNGTPSDSGIYQLVPISPGVSYRISADVRSELQGINGPRLAVFDAYTNERIFLSEEVAGDTDWHEIGGIFRAPGTASLIAVRIVRWPYQTQIRGRLWMDEVTLTQASGVRGGRGAM